MAKRAFSILRSHIARSQIIESLGEDGCTQNKGLF